MARGLPGPAIDTAAARHHDLLVISSGDLPALSEALGPVHPFVRRLRQALDDATDPQLGAYREAACQQAREGDLEIDPDAIVSKGSDHGAYVMAWVWVSDTDREPVPST
jgi:hypothetical protein